MKWFHLPKKRFGLATTTKPTLHLLLIFSERWRLVWLYRRHYTLSNPRIAIKCTHYGEMCTNLFILGKLYSLFFEMFSEEKDTFSFTVYNLMRISHCTTIFRKKEGERLLWASSWALLALHYTFLESYYPLICQLNGMYATLSNI